MSAAINTAAMTREDWLQERRRGIGGSEAAAILGLSPWATPLDVYLDKIGEGEDVEETEAMYFGTILEGVVADEFSRRTGLKVRRRNALLTHPDYPWMIANIDRMVVGGGLLECKTCNAFNPWNGVVPEHYQIQVQHYLAVTGQPFGYIAVLCGGQRFEWAKLERDEAMIQVIIDYEQHFWENHVLKRIPPEPTEHDDMGKVYPVSKPTEIELPATAESLILTYEQARAEEAEAKTKKDRAANRLKALLGDNEAGRWGDRRITWKTVNSSRFDSKRFSKEHEDLYGQYLSESTSRRFGIK